MLLLLIGANTALAQINYVRTTFTSAYTPITVGGGATQINVGTGLGDFSTTGGVASGTEGSAHILWPFNFTYNGVSFTTASDFLGISTNGYVYPVTAAVGGTNAGKLISNVNTNLFTTTSPHATIAPYFDDLSIGTAINGNTGTVLYQVTGSAGSQVLTIQYTNVPAFSSGSVKALNFQVKFYETTNEIEFHYGPVINGTVAGAYNTSETASIGIESATGGNTNYIDAITGSKTANTSLITSNKFSQIRNTRFTPGTPVALAAGTYTVGVGQMYTSLSEAFADLNHRGIAGAVTLDLMDAVYDTTVAGGLNIFPLVTSNIAGTSVANTITVSRTGLPADLRYRGTDAGNLGNQASVSIIGTTFEPILAVIGTDFMSVNNVNFTYNGVQGTGVSYQTTTGKVDCAIGLINSSATDGATNNTFSNFVCTNDRTNPASTQAIRHFTQTTPTSAAGANSNNTYRDFTIKNGTSGIIISGNATFPDINNRVITSACTSYNTIGDPAVANDLSNPSTATSPFGITMSNQSGFTLRNNIISNLTNTSTGSTIVDGINVTLFQGICEINNNIIKNLRQNLGSGTSVVSGIKITNATTGTHEIRVYNNAISNLTTAYNGAASVTRMIRGMSGLSTTNNAAKYSIYNNSISIDGSGASTASNNCFDVAGTTGPNYDVRNNIFANYTIAQAGVARHACYVTNSNTLLGGTGSTINQNNMYVANDAGVTGFPVYNSSTNTGTNPIATVNTNYSTQVTAPNISGDPGFFNIYANLHATNLALLSGAGSLVPAYLSVDLDCNTRIIPNDIGAYLLGACPSGIPTASVSPAGPTCTLEQLTATTSAVTPQYQWMLNGVDIFGATSSTYTPGVAGNGTYTCRVNNLGENCFVVSNAVTVNLSPTISVTPTSAAVCDGETVNINTTVTNNPPLNYTVASIPFAGGFTGTLTNGASLPGGPGLTVGAIADEGNYNVPQNSTGTPTNLPWNFNFYGRNYNQFTIHSNGQLVMNANQTSANSVFSPPTIPSLNAPNNWLGFWADLNVTASDQIRWDVIGTSPARKFVVRFTNVNFFSATPFVTVQYELNETSHDIDVYLTSVNGVTNTKAIGIEDTVVAGVVSGLAAPGRNSGTWIATNEGWRFSQLPPPSYNYAWSPATGLSSTSVSNPVSTPVIGTTVYTVTVTNTSTGCTTTGTTSITNNGVADPAPTVGGPYSFCGSQASVSVTATGNSTINWYSALTGGTLLGTGSPFIFGPVNATTTIYAESFNGLCGSDRTPLTVTITALPTINPTATPVNICLGSTSQLAANSFINGSVTALPTIGNNGVSANIFNVDNLNGTSPITLHFFAMEITAGTLAEIWYKPGAYTCGVTPSNVGYTLAGGVQVPITPLGIGVLTPIPLDANITIPVGQTYAIVVACNGSNRYFNGTAECAPWFSDANIRVNQGRGGSAFGGAFAGLANSPRNFVGSITYDFGDPNLTFNWAPGGTLNSSTITNPIATPTASTVYTVTATNLAGCTSTGTAAVNVTNPPAAPGFTVNSVPCGNGVASLTANGTGGTYKWYALPSGGTVLFTGATFTPTISSDTTFYVSETTTAAPFCEGARTAVFVDIVDPDTINATVDIPLICDQTPGSTLVTLNVTNVSSPQNNQYVYTWSAPGSGGLNATTGNTVTANPTATTIYTVTANQIGAFTVNINGVSANGNTSQDEITWTLKDASNVTILSGGPYAGSNNNVTSLPVVSNNGPFTFQINAGNVLNDTNYAAFTVFCEGNAVASGCVKGSLNVNETACTNISTFSVANINGCLASCNRIATVTVGLGKTPIVNSVSATANPICSGDATIVSVNAVQGGGSGSPAPEFGTYCNPVTYTSPGQSGDFIANVQFNTLNYPSGDEVADYVYVTPVGSATTVVSKGSTYNMTITPTTGFSQATAVFVDWNNNGSFADGGEMVFTGASGTVPVTLPVTVPSGAATAYVRMRVTCVFSGTPGTNYACAPNSFGFGEVEDYTIEITGASSVGLTYAWTPAASLNNSTAASVTATPTTTTTYTVTVSDQAGCTATTTVLIDVVQTPPTPTAIGDTVCGPDTVNLSAALFDPLNTMIWTDTIGGPILHTGTNFSPYASTSGTYYVRELAGASSLNVGFNGVGAPVGFFPDVASFQNFTVLNSEGITINTVQISTNLGSGSYPLVVALVNPLGQIVSVADTVYVTGGSTALQTVTLNLFVPAGSWRLQPIANPNLAVHSIAAHPYTIANQVSITSFGNASNPAFAANFYGLFYNWSVSTACYSLPTIVNYIVNDPPGMSIASTNGSAFCDSISTVLSIIDSTNVFDTFEWSPATGLSATTGSSVSVSSLTNVSYTVIARDTNSGCNNVQTIDLIVNPAPTVILSFTDTTVCTTQPTIAFNATAAKSSVAQIGTRINPNFVNGQIYGGNTTQYAQMIFTPAELNAAGIVGPTNITSLAFHVMGKLTTTTYTVSINLRADGTVPANFASATHLTPIGAANFTSSTITSALGWNTYNFTTPFAWDGVSNVLVSTCFTHNIPGFFDVVSTSNAGAVRLNALNASACGAITGGLAAINPNDRPNVRFTGGNVTYSWSPALGLSGSTIEDPTVDVTQLPVNATTTYILTVTDPVSGCTANDTVNVEVLPVPLAPLAADTNRCGFGQVVLNATAQGGYTLNWYDAPTGGNLLGSGSPFIYELGATTTIYVEEFNGGCAGPRTAVNITIFPAPAVNTSSVNAPICDGAGPATLTASSVNDPNYMYEWSPALGLSATTGAVVSASPVVNTTYTVLGIDTVTGCQDTATVFVGVGNSIIINSVTAVQDTICVGGTTSLLVTTPPTGAYTVQSIPFAPVVPISTSLSGVGPVGDEGTLLGAPIGFNFDYFGTIYNSVTVHTNGYIVFAPPAYVFGSFSPTTIPNAANTNSWAGFWADLNAVTGNITFGTTGVAPFRKFVINYNNVNYFSATPFVSHQIVLNETFNTIDVHMQHAQTTNTQAIGMENQTGTIGTAAPGRNAGIWSTDNESWSFAPPATVNYAWSPATGLSSTSVANPIANPTTTTTYTVVITATESGCTSTGSVTIEVLSIPTDPIVMGLDTNCGPALLTFTADPGNLVDTVKWYDAATGGTLLGVGDNLSILVSSTITIYAERTNGTCLNPGGRTAHTIVINPAPAVAIDGAATICENSSTPLSVSAATVGNYNNYIWLPATGLNTTVGPNVIASPIVTTTYTVYASSPTSGDSTCGNAATVTVTVNPAPIITSVSISPTPVCEGDSVQLTVVTPSSGPSNYTVTSIPFAPVLPSGPTTELSNGGVAIQALATGSLDDGTWNVSLPVGFAFDYYGVPQTTLDVSTNGFIGFGGLSGLNGCCTGQLMPNASTPNNVVAMAWEDWNHTAGIMDVFTVGTTPFRKFVIRAQGVPRFGGASGPTTAMIVLNETLNTIEIHNTSVVCVATDFTTQGIENGSGTLATTVTGRNSTGGWSATNDAWRFAPPTSVTYSWAPNAGMINSNTANPQALATANTTYTVTVTNIATGCTSTATVASNVTALPKPYLNAGDTIFCSNVPQFTVTVGDSGAYAGGWPVGTLFDWGVNGGVLTDSFITIFASANVNVIVTLPPSMGGCTAGSDTSTFDLGTILTPVLTFQSDSVICYGDSTGRLIGRIDSVFSGTPNYRWQWFTSPGNVLLRDVTNSELVDTLDNIPAGSYYLLLTDHQGVPVPPYCQPDIIIESVGEPVGPLLVLEELAGHIDVQCYGYATGAIDLTVMDGTAPYTYDWSTGETTEDITGLVAGIYTCTVTDVRGCTYEFVTEIFENPQVTVGTDQTNVSCNGGFDGTATVYVNGGVGGYTYLWDNGSTDQTAFDLTAGVHTVIITDNSGTPGCDTIISFLITEPTLLDATSNVINLNCHGASNGVATAFPTGGNPPYNYSWNSIPVQTTQTATGLAAGTYTCSITDSTGCMKDLIIQITQPDSLVVGTTIDDPSCNGSNDGSVTATVTGGTPGYAYLWSNGETTETASNLTAGTYVLTVTDANGCQVISNIVVNEPLPITTTVTCLTDVTCNGLSNGTACILATGGTPGYSYLWNTVPAQTTATATGLAAGSYTLIITDAAGCTATVTVTINEPAAISANAEVTNPLCNGGMGSIELIPTGGTAPYSVIWSNGSTNLINGGLLAGTYTATITDANGCVLTETYTITDPAAIVVSGTVTNVSCNGGVNGAIILNVTGGSGSYLYQWSNGETTANITGLLAGSYTVTVTDLTSCSVTQTFVVAEPAALSCVCNANVVNVSCFGAADGSITAQPMGGTAPYSYSWIRISPTVSGVLATTQTISGLTAGTYEVTITDANGCTKVGTAVVTEPNQLFAFGTVSGGNCGGSSNGSIAMTVFGGIPPYSYVWNTIPAQTTAIATGLGAGSYTCVVTDANGCTVAVTNTISTPAPIVLTTTKTNARCNGASNGTATVNATGGVSPYNYMWSNGKTTSNILGLPAGTYTVTVTDANGCTAIATVAISHPSKVAALYVSTNPTCYGASNGAINLTVTGGTPPYTYTWSNGSTNEDQAGLTAGIYSVVIKDNKGCVLTAMVTLVQPNAIVVSTSINNVKCNGANTGKATANVTGGTAPYTYLWSTGGTTVTIKNLAAGTYTVTVTDSKGCTGVGTATINQPAALVCNTTVINNVSCFGGTNGKVQVSVSGGKAPYTYLWNTNPIATTAIVNNVAAGTYTVTVKDKNNCTTVCMVTVTQPASAMSLTMSGSVVACNGGNTGTASVVASGGTAPYTYLWNTIVAQTTSSIAGLTAGTYMVTVTDANGCTQTGNAVVTENTALTITATTSDLVCGITNTGQVNAVANGGLAPYTYVLGPLNLTQASGLFTGLAQGTYDVTVTDAAGCTAVITGLVVNQPAPLSMGATSGTNVTCFGGNNGTATAGVVTGGTMPYSYSWNTVPPQATATATGLVAGTYIVTVTDAGGCTTSGNVTITEPATAMVLSIVNQTNPSCSGGATGTAEVDATGGTGPYTYLWSDGQTTAAVTGLMAGTYQVTATDANGCQAMATIIISQPNQFVVTATFTDVLCNGNSDGTITASVSGGNAPFSYDIGIANNNTGLFTGLAAGNYIVTVTDNGGCTATTSVTISEPSALIANSTSTNVACAGGSNGNAAVFVVGGVMPYAYAWSNGNTTQNVSALSAGTYTATVTDANGCTITSEVIITEPAAIALSTTQVDVVCNGGNTGSATVNATGGSAPYFYMWSNGQMTQTATGLSAGVYTVTVADYNGCTQSIAVTINSSTSIVVNPTAGTITCFGGTTTVSVAPTGGTAPYSYTWSHDGGNTTNTAIVGAGVYYVTITDSLGCQVTYCFIVTEPAQLMCAISSTNVLCNDIANGTATVSTVGGTPGYTYLWSNGSTDAALTGLAAGSYTVTVTDANGCTSVCSVTIAEPAVLTLGTSTSNTSCGTDNGTATAVVGGGTMPYSYIWSTGETTASIANLAAGSYTVVVMDANGCGPLTATVVIGNNAPVSCTTTTINPTCSGYANGSASVVAAGGNGSYTYMWNTAPIQTTITATGLAAGTYEVVVTDLSGCTSVCTVELTEPDPLVLTSTQNNNACNGGVSGIATVTPYGGTPYTVGEPYTYLWTNGVTTATATGLASGTYYVTVTDSVGCSAVICIIMQQPVVMSCNTSTTPTVCGQAIGSATVNVFGGQAPFTYMWNTAPMQTNAIATLLSAGTYTVVVTDANGCTTSCTATVVQPGSVSYTLAVVNAACSGGMGTITASGLNGGTPPYNYMWSNGATTVSINDVAGTYTLTVTDANGCSVTQTATITEPALLVAGSTQVDVTCNGNSNGSACATVTGGTQPYTYSWNTGASSVCVNGLVAGSYTVTVTDANGCTSSTVITIAQPAVLDSSSTSATVASCGLSNGTGTVNITGGTAPYTYAWNTVPVQTTQTATGLMGGNNFVTVTDANGCSVTICVAVPASNGIGLSLNSPVYAGGVNIRCNGGADGSVNLTTSGAGPFTYSWSNGATTEDVFGLTAGTYTVTVTDGGCTASASITLTEATAIALSTTQVNVTCQGAATGSAKAIVTGGTAPYTYSWNTSPVQTNALATGLVAGVYTVTVGDANGCTQTASVTITEPANGLSITATSINPNCNGNSNGSIDISVSGGSLPYSFLWSDGAITEDRTNLPAGSHTVTVTDANGCTIQLCVVLTQPTQIAVTTSKSNVSCSGGNTGSANASAAGGTAPYTYLWNTGATTAAISSLSAGTYTVTVTDANGCTRISNVVINASTPITLTTSTTNVSVYGGNNGTATVTSVSGGVAPYAYTWNTIPAQTNVTATGLAAGNYQVTVIDNLGCIKTASVTITQPNFICSSGTPFRTETPSRWGAATGTAATYLTANFSAAFPAGLVVGGGCVGGKTLTLTNATAVRNYEVNQVTSGSGTQLGANLVNPTSLSFPSALAANCVALTLNVTFDAYDPNFAPIPTVQLGNMIYTAAPFAGLTVNQILSEANKKLGGCSSAFTITALNIALQNIDSAYKAGVTGPTAAMLTCPGAPRIASNLGVTTTSVLVYPNPSAGVVNVKLETEVEGTVVINMLDITGRAVWNTQEPIFTGENVRTYDFSQLTKGVYMMQVIKDGKSEIIRVVLR
ncbi:MAG: T9SS type A sorting domain-containing protein [Bacteroidia bacterium]|nr:T9SS type A sorting domain-containing protein [Bacteroidia bacterium]